MSTRLNFEKTNREIKRSSALSSLLFDRRIQNISSYTQKKKQHDVLLKQKGWQVCPSCGGGRHPAFPLCRRCVNTSLGLSEKGIHQTPGHRNRKATP